MRALERLLPAALVPLLLLVACGDDDTSADPGAAAPADDGSGGAGADAGADDEWPPEDLPGTGEAGRVTIDGTEYAIDVVRRCDLEGFDAGDHRTREFEVQGAGMADPDDEFSDPVEVSVFAGTNQNPVADSQGIGWDGPEGLYDGYETGADQPLDVGEDRITGTMLLRSSLGNPPVEATIDVAVPDSDPVSCHD